MNTSSSTTSSSTISTTSSNPITANSNDIVNNNVNTENISKKKSKKKKNKKISNHINEENKNELKKLNLDTSEEMKNILKNRKEKQKSKNILSVFDQIPEMPNERSKTKMKLKKKMTEREHKQNHIIYQEFNKKIFEIIDNLGVRFPECRTEYEVFKNVIKIYISKDISIPMNKWIECIKGHEDCLREYSSENEEIFLKFAPNVSILKSLRISEKFNIISQEEKKILWEYFQNLLMLSEAVEAIPPELMSIIQDLAVDLNKTIDPKNLSIQNVASHVFKAMQTNEELTEGIKNLVTNCQTSNTMPPSISRFYQQLQKDY